MYRNRANKKKNSGEIHIRCPSYLEVTDYRCSRCEAKTFLSEYNAPRVTNKEQLQEIYDTIRPYEIFQSQGIPCQNVMDPTEGHGNERENFLAKVKSVQPETRERTIAGSCECAQLVETVLIPRLGEWKCSANVNKIFYYLLETAAAFCYLKKYRKAIDYLFEAKAILENRKGLRLAYPPLNICELQQAFMYRLTGEILFKVGFVSGAENHFRKALKLLKCNLPRNSVAQSLKLIHERMKKRRYRSRQFEIKEETKLGRLQECIICLSFLWEIAYVRGEFKSASLAITMEVNLAIQSADPFKILFSAIHYLKYKQLKGQENMCRHLEAFLYRTCASLSDYPEGQQLMTSSNDLEKIFNQCVLHLNANFRQLIHKETSAQDLLKEALLLCEKQGNLLDQMWIRQSQITQAQTWISSCRRLTSSVHLQNTVLILYDLEKSSLPKLKLIKAPLRDV